MGFPCYAPGGSRLEGARKDACKFAVRAQYAGGNIEVQKGPTGTFPFVWVFGRQ
jgi:hypothetical protein